MALDTNNSDRSYLFGRLLAYAQRMESYSLHRLKIKRATNAERLMHEFSVRPVSTWSNIKHKLMNYEVRLKDDGLMHIWETEMNAILSRLDGNGFTDMRLSPDYLLGYASQMHEFDIKQKPAAQKQEEENE